MSDYTTHYANLIIELGNLERSKEWGRMEVFAKQILVQYPASIYAMKRLGKALEKQGKVNKAIGCYENAIAVARAARSGHVHFIKRLDILYRRLKKHEDCFQSCLYYADTHSDSPEALNRLARSANLVGQNELGNVAKALAKKLNEPFKPRGKPLPHEELDNLATITDDDIQRAIDDWNKTVPEFAGLLEATVYTGDISDLEDSSEFEEERAYMQVEPKPRPAYSDDDIRRICQTLSQRLRVYS